MTRWQRQIATVGGVASIVLVDRHRTETREGGAVVSADSQGDGTDGKTRLRTPVTGVLADLGVCPPRLRQLRQVSSRSQDDGGHGEADEEGLLERADSPH